MERKIKLPWHECDPSALQDLQDKLRQSYPTLSASIENEGVVVTGSYGVIHDGEEIDRYSLEIKLPYDYPRSLPSVWETGQRIPRIIERHVFPNNSALCLGVPVALWLEQNGNFEKGLCTSVRRPQM